jgi:hypothetical protein
MSDAQGLDKECFFIAPIGDEGSPERRRSDGVLEAIVEPAASELELSAIRADGLAKPGQITSQIIEHVLGAKAAVADLTGKNANVLYELAIRHTARLPVVLIAEDGEVLPFDTAQMRTIFFNPTDMGSTAKCRKGLVVQLREALSGNFDSPVDAALDLRSLRSSGDAVQRGIADVLNVVGDISTELGATRRDIQRLGRETADMARQSPVVSALQDLTEAIDLADQSAQRYNLEELAESVYRMRSPLDYLTSAMSRGRWLDDRESIAPEAFHDLQRSLVEAMASIPPDNRSVRRHLNQADRALQILMRRRGLVGPSTRQMLSRRGLPVDQPSATVPIGEVAPESGPSPAV